MARCSVGSLASSCGGSGELQHPSHRAIELRLDQPEDLLPRLRGERSIAPRDPEVALGEHHVEVLEHGGQERPLARHLQHHLLAVVGHHGIQATTHAIPPGQHVAALGPREDPRNRPKVLHAGTRATGCGPRADRHPLDHVDRRGMPEVIGEAGMLVHQRAIGPTARCSQVGEDRLPLAEPRVVGRWGSGGEEGGRGAPLQRPEGDATQAVLGVDHLALLGEPQPAVHGAARGGQDAAVGLAAAAPDGAAAAVEEGQLDSRVAGDTRRAWPARR